MKRFYQKNLLTALLLLIGYLAMAQDIHFSQFYETPLYRNPALAGIVTGDVRVQSVMRNQWNSIAHAYKTGSVNAEYKSPVGNGDDYMTLGLQLFYDKAGTAELTSTQVLPALNFHKSISSQQNAYLSLGFMGGLVQRRFDRSKITTNSQYENGNDGESFSQPQYSYFDGSVGMSLNAGFGDNEDNNYFIGAAYHHINKPRNTFYSNGTSTVTPKYVVSGGVRFGVTEDSYLTLQGDYSKQGQYNEATGGVLYAVKLGYDVDQPDYTIEGGAFLRLNDAVIPTIKVDYHPFSVGLSYDVNVSKLKASSYGRGGFELSLTYIGFLDRDNSTLNASRCPRF